MGDWTPELVLISDPKGGAYANAGFTAMAAVSEQLTGVVDSLSRVPWNGEAAEVFRGYLGGLRRSVVGATDVATACATASGTAGTELEGLRGPATETADLLNNLIDKSAALREDGVNLFEIVELAKLRGIAEGALARVRDQREEILSTLATATHTQIDALAGLRPPTAPDPSQISDPAQRALVQKLHDEIEATMAAAGDTANAREWADRIAAADSELERLWLIRAAAEALSPAELDNLMDNLDPQELAAALGEDGLLGLSDDQRLEFYNLLGGKLDMDTLTGLGEQLPDDPWHPDPYKGIPQLNDENLEPDGWNLSWSPIDGAGEPITADGINPEDIQQAGLGDCFLQSNLYSMAATEEGRQFLADHIQLNDNGTYTVTIYDENGNAVPVVVTPDAPMAQTDDGWSSQYDSEEHLWVQLYEKAFAQAAPQVSGEDVGYPSINGGYTGDTLNRITGQEVNSVDMSDAGSPFVQPALQQAEQSNAPITVSVHESVDLNGDGNTDVYGGHAYSLDHIDWDSEPPMVHLRNPWGSSHATITYEQFTDLNGQIHVGQAR